RVLDTVLEKGRTRPGEPMRLSLRDLARAAEIERGPVLAEAALRALERAGALRIEDAQRAGDADLRVVVVEGDAENPPSVDWRMLRRGREREYTKLEWMQRYAYTRGCRRGFVLRYFGDPAAMRHCGACDRCLAADAGLTAGPARPRAHQLRAHTVPATGGACRARVLRSNV